MDGVKVTGRFNADALFQTMAAILSAKGYGVEVSLRSCEKATEWVSIVRRVQRTAERDSA
jgi:hypothetical protein